MNKEDRSRFLTLIDAKNPALLAGVDRDAADDAAIMTLVEQAMSPPPADVAAANGAGLSAGELEALCDRHHLEYAYSERAEEIRDGVTRRVWQRRTRPMLATDILSHRLLAGGVVRVVTADGRKLELRQGMES